eukprot:TRINITY_DN3392_c0_g1_i4.p1 TRINITY_DN3392_c0_g1~~TRINITY_DN3392_c0_g1_i4.p1  ORF type:complete len:151 (-),score=8.71 TRINITY_DN3392_c0_g1_i4:10-462(-)
MQLQIEKLNAHPKKGVCAISLTKTRECINSDKPQPCHIARVMHRARPDENGSSQLVGIGARTVCNSVAFQRKCDTVSVNNFGKILAHVLCVDTCLLYTSDAADEEDSVDLGGRRISKKKKKRTPKESKKRKKTQKGRKTKRTESSEKREK